MNQRKLVDPVHFFDQQGSSLLNAEFLSKRVDELTAENKRLTRLLEAQVRKNQATAVNEEKIRIH